MKFIILSAILLMFVGCGTETGNPMQEGEPTSSNDPSMLTSAYGVANRSCDKIKDCFGVDSLKCLDSIQSAGNFDIALGLGSSFPTLEDVITAEVDSTITVNDIVARDQCYTDINNLDCSDSEVINAYDSGDPDNFSSMANIVPVGAGACQDFY